MQEEITAFQPVLLKKSAETDLMMAQMEKETVLVDAKKELVEADEKVANIAAAAAKEIKVKVVACRQVASLRGVRGVFVIVTLLLSSG